MGRFARRGAVLVVALAGVSGLAAPAHAGSIDIVSNNAYASYGAASFTGTISYQADSPFSTTGTLIVTLTNVTAESRGGYITGFIFGINSTDATASATLLNSPAPSHQFLNVPPVPGYPGGASLGGNFADPYEVTSGIGVGQTGTFVFTINAADAGTLTAEDFLGLPGDPYGFLVRASGFIDDCSGPDYVPAMMVVVPLPAPLALGGLGLAAVALIVARRGRAASV